MAKVTRLQKRAKAKVVVEPEGPHICYVCGTEYKTMHGNFTPTNLPLFSRTGHFPVCRRCLGKYYDELVEVFNGDEEKAMDYMCAMTGVYFNEATFISSAKINSSNSRFNTYVSKVQLNPWTGMSYLDTIKEREDDTNIISSYVDLAENNADHDREVSVSKTSVETWGFGFTPEDYAFLDGQYSDWASKAIIEGKPKEMLVRELCVLKLQQNKALMEGKVDLYNKLTDTFQKTLDRANLTPKIEDSVDKASEIPMGMMIERFEKEEPVPEPLEEWEDVDGIIRMFTIYFLGHLCKMLGIKNSYSQLYEEEMAKYRVTLPDMEEAEDDDIFDFLIDDSGEIDDEEGDEESP